MSARLVDRLAQHIRTVDGGNRLSPGVLGREVATYLMASSNFTGVDDLIGYVEFINPDKTMGAGALAEAIVTEFDLDKED